MAPGTTYTTQKNSQLKDSYGEMAERVGFEPTCRLPRLLDFESSPL